MRILTCFVTFLLALVGAWASPTFRIGVSAPLTGDLAEYGMAVSNGIALAEEEFPALSQSVQFLFEDNRYEAKSAVAALQALQLRKVDLLYNWGETTLFAIAPLVERAHLPTLAMSATASPARGKHWVVRAVNHSGEFADVLLRYTRARGFTRIGLVYTDDIFFEGLIQGLRNRLMAREELALLENVAADSQDFRAQLMRLQQRKVDAIGVFLFPGQVSSWFRQARELGLSLPSFGTDIFESVQELKLAQGSMDGALYPNLAVPSSFRNRLEARFPSSTQISYAYNAFVMARHVLGVVAELRQRPSAEELLKLIRESVCNGARYRESSEGGAYFEFPLVLREIRGERFVDYAFSDSRHS